MAKPTPIVRSGYAEILSALPDWDALFLTYNHVGFIVADPISFVHRYLDSDDWRDAELVAVIAALFSYGRRDKILETVDAILSPLGPHPVAMLMSLPPARLRKMYKGFYYRFNTASDLVFLLSRFGALYHQHESLKTLWQECFQQNQTLPEAISAFRAAVLGESGYESNGIRFLLANPIQNSAAKRFNMLLRWLVRKDSVDVGLWADTMPTAELHFPLDTHVAFMARHYAITNRKSNDWKTVAEITRYFQLLDSNDPVKYDFALFGLGIEHGKSDLDVIQRPIL